MKPCVFTVALEVASEHSTIRFRTNNIGRGFGFRQTPKSGSFALPDMTRSNDKQIPKSVCAERDMHREKTVYSCSTVRSSRCGAYSQKKYVRMFALSIK